MKKLSSICLAALLAFVFTACTNAPESDEAKTSEAKAVSDSATGQPWNVDTNASKVEWVATKVSGYHTGTVDIKNGELQVADGNVTGGNFTLDMTSIAVLGPKGSDPARNAKLLGHLKSPDFFEVDKNPEATFVITSVQPFTGTAQDTADPRQEDISEYKVPNPTHTVSGNLTIKGVAKNIQFPARITVTGNSADAMAKFNIDRTQWNIVYPGQPDDLIRNDIHLGIALKAAK